jgi:hypothetical protein
MMPVPEQDRIASTLSSMTVWGDSESQVWRSALEIARPARKPRGIFARRLVGAIAAMLLVCVSIGILLPSLGKPRASSRQSVPASSVASEPLFRSMESSPLASYYASPSPALAGSIPATVAPQTDSAKSADRMVVRKASIELKTADVRAVFVKTAQVISEAHGEYIQESSLTGDEVLYADITLRVSAQRLSSVLNQLRGFAQVTSETSTGEDVTDAAVDLDARLRNEQRVETELLALLSSRKDAPLKEVLDLRDSITRVRENIERLTAQRDRLARLVSLATVTVIIRADGESSSHSHGFGTYFRREIAAAWEGALEFLADTLAFLVRVIVGGAIFWTVGAAALLAALAAGRRRKRRLGQEPAPAV